MLNTLSQSQGVTLALPQREELVNFCKATADALRLDILRALRTGSFGVSELCHIFSVAQPAMSHHLKVLANAQLVQTRREGNSIFYRRANTPIGESMHDLIKSFFSTVDLIELEPDARTRMDEVYQERANNSRAFFARNADRLKENQDLITEFGQYAGCVRDLLSNEGLSSESTALELGPGESPLLLELAKRFKTVFAVDNSEEMLNKARQMAANESIDNVDFHAGDLSSAFAAGLNADLVVLNMVLHHLAAPAQLFSDFARHANDGARLMVIDLCPHEQDWVADVCGDLWLGFEPSELDEWASEFDLSQSQSAYLGLKNGFQVQVRLFQKASIIN